jgi:hypothetical protein
MLVNDSPSNSIQITELSGLVDERFGRHRAGEVDDAGQPERDRPSEHMGGSISGCPGLR